MSSRRKPRSRRPRLDTGPIDLIDGDRLVALLIEHQLGMKQITIVDHDFLAPFQ
jgi:restriction endonuclease Mrr